MDRLARVAVNAVDKRELNVHLRHVRVGQPLFPWFPGSRRPLWRWQCKSFRSDTIVTLNVELQIIVIFLVMGMRVIRLFSQMDEGTSSGKNSSPTGSRCDVEHGSFVDVARTRGGVETRSYLMIPLIGMYVCTHSAALN